MENQISQHKLSVIQDITQRLIVDPNTQLTTLPYNYFKEFENDIPMTFSTFREAKLFIINQVLKEVD